MDHLVMPRLVARSQLHRHAIKLRFWERADARLADLSCIRIPGETLFALELADAYGLADGFRIVFCEAPNPEPDGTIVELAVIRADEPLTAPTVEILQGRERIARERLSVDSHAGTVIPRTEYDDD
jgi:hypothetical protein